jgi:hypothetical protein
MNKNSIIFFSVLSLLVMVAGCGVAPQSKYRYSAAIPAAKPLAWDGRTAKRGSLRLEGSYQSTSVQENLTPALHDTAVHVATKTVHGGAFLAVTNAIEVGLRVSYSSESWMTASSVGTMPLGKDRDLFGAGPEIRISIPISKRFNLGIAGNQMFYSLPISAWVLDDTCTQNRTNRCYDGYRNTDNTKKEAMAFNLAMYPSFALDEQHRFGHIFFGWSGHTSYKNDGFTNQEATTAEDSLSETAMVHFMSAGYGLVHKSLRASVMLSAPIGNNNNIRYGSTLSLTLGGQFHLF